LYAIAYKNLRQEMRGLLAGRRGVRRFRRAPRDAALTGSDKHSWVCGVAGLASGPPECQWVVLACGCARKLGAGY